MVDRTDGGDYAEDCEHLFKQARRWSRRWVCVRCSFATRRYDSIDARMTRPVHQRMTVALPGFNTTRGDR